MRKETKITPSNYLEAGKATKDLVDKCLESHLTGLKEFNESQNLGGLIYLAFNAKGNLLCSELVGIVAPVLSIGELEVLKAKIVAQVDLDRDKAE